MCSLFPPIQRTKKNTYKDIQSLKVHVGHQMICDLRYVSIKQMKQFFFGQTNIWTRVIRTGKKKKIFLFLICIASELYDKARTDGTCYFLDCGLVTSHHNISSTEHYICIRQWNVHWTLPKAALIKEEAETWIEHLTLTSDWNKSILKKHRLWPSPSIWGTNNFRN